MRIVYVIIVLSSNIFSQIISSYGLKVGVSSASQEFDYASIPDEVEFHYRYGMYVDIFAELMESEHFSFVLDLSYNQKGMIDKLEINKVWPNADGFISEIKEFDNRLDYLTASINLKTRLDKYAIIPYILTGLKYDILIGKKISSAQWVAFEKYDYNRLYNKFKGNVLGLKLGAGIETKSLFGIAVLLEWVYNHDLTKTRTSDVLEITNLSNELKLGIKF